MRKFVNKNRKKRKYTKKSDAVSSYSFPKTAYGMVPLLIMIVAFMSSIIISTPLRDSLSNIRFTMELPKFSLSNPLSFILTILLDSEQLGITLWSLLISLAKTITQSFLYLVVFVNNGFTFAQQAISSIWRSLLFALTVSSYESAKGVTSIQAFFIIISTFCVVVIQSIAHFISQTILFGIHSIIIATIFLYQRIIGAVLYLVQFLFSISLFVGNVILTTAETIGTFFISIWNSIIISIQHAISAFVRTIEFPFKLLYVYWLQIKPYADILGNHIRMAGNDFTNGFTDIGKVASLMSSHK